MNAHEPAPPADIDRRARALADRLEASGHWVSLDGRIREQTAAHILDATPRTLARWREQGTGPAFIVIGRALSYRLTDILQWIDSRRHAA